MARAYARRTQRLASVISAVGYVAGGLPATRLLERLAIRLSDDSVRRQVIRDTASQQEQEPVRHLGIDDWAWRKYLTYGTILVDLDRHRVVDLLADRAADSVAKWLEEHPTVEIVTRDRSGLYADGAATGAPQALQVADRFHLILNLSAAVERALEERSRELVLPAVTPLPTDAKPTKVEPMEKLTAPQALKQQRRQRRLERYERVTQLSNQGYSKMAISRELSISPKTVRRWLRADQFPERKLPAGRPKQVAEYADYLDTRWKSGCHNATQLFTEIRTRGFKGSRGRVNAYLSPWRVTGSRPSVANAPQRITPKHAAILATQEQEQLSPEQQALLARLTAHCADLLPIRNIALAFRNVLATSSRDALLRWLQETKLCRFGPLVRFAYGLQKDIAAVTAAVETNWSNGQVEGQINRLKAIKRQMYGRAGFRYLRSRVLPCAVLAAPSQVNPP